MRALPISLHGRMPAPSKRLSSTSAPVPSDSPAGRSVPRRRIALCPSRISALHLMQSSALLIASADGAG